MKTEDVPLNIKEIFEKKGEQYSPEDIARARNACRVMVENMIAMRRLCKVGDQMQLQAFLEP